MTSARLELADAKRSGREWVRKVPQLPRVDGYALPTFAMHPGDCTYALGVGYFADPARDINLVDDDPHDVALVVFAWCLAHRLAPKPSLASRAWALPGTKHGLDWYEVRSSRWLAEVTRGDGWHDSVAHDREDDFRFRHLRADIYVSTRLDVIAESFTLTRARCTASELPHRLAEAVQAHHDREHA